MSFKLTFWTMLFIIVVVLALSYFMDTNVSQEGFGSYNYTANNNTKTKIAIYSTEKELIKLYDCLYFDESNGNIIEIISKKYENKETNDDITGINIIQRSSGTISEYMVNTDANNIMVVTDRNEQSATINESNNLFKSVVNNSFIYDTTMNVPQYSVIVHANNDETLIHIMDNSTRIFVNSYLFSKDADNKSYTYSNDKFNVAIIGSKTSNILTGDNYSKITNNVVYDKTNGNVIVTENTKEITIVSTDGNILNKLVSDYVSEKNDNEITEWVANTTNGNTIIHYPSKNGVYISVLELQKESSSTHDTTAGVATDTITGVATNTTSGVATNTTSGVATDTTTGVATNTTSGVATDTTTGVATDTTTGVATDTTTGVATDTTTDVVTDAFTTMVGPDTYKMVATSVYIEYTETPMIDTEDEKIKKISDNTGLSELEKAFEVMERGKELYGHLFGLDKNSKSGGEYGEDYFLKTEVVPPVCPMCPGCVSGCNGVCNDCGGNGGSGTKGSDGKSITGNNKNAIEKTVDSAGNVIEKTVDSAGNVIEKTLDSAGNVIEKTLDSAGNVISEVGTGTKQVAGDVYGAIGTAGAGAKQVAGDVYGATTGVAGDVYGATTGVAGDIYGATTGVAGDIYGAATGVIGDLYSGVTNLSGATQLLARQQQGNVNTTPVQNKSQMNMTDTSQMNMTGTSQMPSYQNSVTNYDYYGALPNKTSNYVARTADFSSF